LSTLLLHALDIERDNGGNNEADAWRFRATMEGFLFNSLTCPVFLMSLTPALVFMIAVI